MKQLARFSSIILIVLSCTFLFIFYQNIILSPNSYLFADNGDAIKNYFTYAAHIKESTWVNSCIMNYPYGENFLFLDCHPVFTVVLNSLSNVFPSISNYSIGIINFLMIFSIVLSSIFLYLILVELKVNRFISAFGAFSIAVLAPQIFRITGHLALSYSFFIPLSLYLFIRFSNSQFKLKWSIILFINNIFWYFVHAYLGMIVVSFLFFCFIADFIFYERKKYKCVIQWLYVSLQTFLPLLSFYIVALLTDKHVGRTTNPYGFLVYLANIRTIFIPHHAPLKPIVDHIISIKQTWEGWAYIGVGSSISIMLFIVNRTLKRYNKSTLVDDKDFFNNRPLILAISSSVVLLFLSMGYPFKLKMEFLLNWFPLIKNFRGIGRFSWVFFYVITIASLYFINLLYQSNKKKPIYIFLLVFLPLSYLLEGISYHIELSKTITLSPNLFNKSQLPEEYLKGLPYADTAKYQAIIPLPFYHIGSENFEKSGTDKIYRISMILSYHSGIPIMGNYSTRTSILESKKLVQLLSPDFYTKEIENDIKSNKPFLVVYSHEQLTEQENLILERSRLIFSNNSYSIYSLSKEQLFKNSYSDEIKKFLEIKNQLTSNSGFLTNAEDSNSKIIYNSFENFPGKISFSGNGSFSGQMKNYNQLEKIESNKLIKDREYILSFWMYNMGENYGQDAMNSMVFIQTEDKNEKVEWLALTNPANSFVINGSWSLIELGFKITNSENRISVYLKGDDNSKKSFYIDDLLIREKDVDVYKIIKENNNQPIELFKNNHRILQN